MKDLKLEYKLAELPSAQHRAGLAGLVLMVQYLRDTQPWFKQREGAVLELQNLNEFGVTLLLNLQGLQALFDLTYQAFSEVRSTETKIKKYDRVEEDEVPDKKDKTKTKRILKYFYTVTTPQGAFLADWDKSNDSSERGLWIKLWRNMLWQIVRGVPATRNSFNHRVNGAAYSQDVQDIWSELQQPNKITGQSGNYYLGAMATNSEYVRTQDKVRYQFLLHFWVFVAQIYCPAILDKDGNREPTGYALAIPDVANLKNFCRVFPKVLRNRNIKQWRYLPREAVIDLPEEGALDLLLLLRDRIARETGDQEIRRLILGVEIIHAEKVGNNIKIRSISIVSPTRECLDKYQIIKTSYLCPWFRKQRLINLLRQQTDEEELYSNLPKIQPWSDFDAVLSRIPRTWLQNYTFNHDARNLFETEIGIKMKKEIRDYALIVYNVCQGYVIGKLENKYKIRWHNSKKCYFQDKKQIPQADGDDKKKKIANEAFLAVRSRTDTTAFIDYFVSTLYPFVKKDEFVNFADVLFNHTNEIRALTLLALSSQFPLNLKEDNLFSEEDAA
ncbi:type I-MYXAN CRISPR-associated protein Cmx8 [Nostoc spongiaeforme FACHB-130]|uniref:Type I-MYXAN CRISPR-associated protein Cmx8 n=1 Tax=Nostoc spongiaeforme FACHB-130 TaxID=1357510 RepID=A0ABR8G5D8_9NOSO|nr:type I-MYXAN CRISPR-associated protein Cmx8 [Nostoc spongiaeforme]MBD2598366.1 type I-MYXAN CRISPR-associated protein Cmx8 [Nostoc spongiaeforme FACHB-130]